MTTTERNLRIMQILFWMIVATFGVIVFFRCMEAIEKPAETYRQRWELTHPREAEWVKFHEGDVK